MHWRTSEIAEKQSFSGCSIIIDYLRERGGGVIGYSSFSSYYSCLSSMSSAISYKSRLSTGADCRGGLCSS